MTFVEYLRIFGCVVIVMAIMPTFVLLIRLATKYRSMTAVTFHIIFSMFLMIGMIVGAVWLGYPYGNCDSPNKHLPSCNTRINGLWLPGKHCTCGARNY